VGRLSLHRKKILWCGCDDKTEGIGIFVAKQWTDKIIQADKHSERIMVVNMVLCYRLVNVSYTLHTQVKMKRKGISSLRHGTSAGK